MGAKAGNASSPGYPTPGHRCAAPAAANWKYAKYVSDWELLKQKVAKQDLTKKGSESVPGSPPMDAGAIAENYTPEGVDARGRARLPAVPPLIDEIGLLSHCVQRQVAELRHSELIWPPLGPVIDGENYHPVAVKGHRQQ